jgi:hypothetical protein
MASLAPTPPTSVLEDFRNLVGRLRQSEAFQHYLSQRKERVALLVVLCVTLSLACASGLITSVLGLRPIIVLAAVLAVPFVLLGSLALLLYALFSWLENVALAQALHHGRPELPRVPWGFAAVFVFVPLLLLAIRMPLVALPLLALSAAAPVLYLRFERQKR